MKGSIVTAALILVALAGTLMLSSLATSFYASAQEQPPTCFVTPGGKIIHADPHAGNGLEASKCPAP